jgi:hypothetical protein
MKGGVSEKGRQQKRKEKAEVKKTRRQWGRGASRLR